METTPIKLSGINDLVQAIRGANRFFLDQTQRQVNSYLTLRNWVVGYYIVEYEQNGKDRAEYGGQLFERLAGRIKKVGVKGLSFTILHTCVQFYSAYPQLVRSVSGMLQLTDNQIDGILQSVTEELGQRLDPTPAAVLLSKLSFTHFAELVKVDSPLKRLFYETETIANNWSVRELKRAIDSLLFERTGLSKDKEAVLAGHRKGVGLLPADVFRDPYLLDFLGLEEKPNYVETDLEGAIITNLQKFLLEMGRGFCFEGRQKRITFDNTHYRIDLVFYHRLLRCHVLIDLKMGRFTPADAGQMQMYLNYFKENEAGEGDNPPIGIILCTDKSETLVKYATAGLAQPVFVSKHMTNLPSEQELQRLVLEQQEKVRGEGRAARLGVVLVARQGWGVRVSVVGAEV